MFKIKVWTDTKEYPVYGFAYAEHILTAFVGMKSINLMWWR